MSTSFHISSDARIDEELCRFWTQEAVDLSGVVKSEHVRAEAAFTASCRKFNRQYQVGLLFKDQAIINKLGESYSMAARRFMYLERKLHREPDLFKEYKAFIDEYLRLGHASVVNRK